MAKRSKLREEQDKAVAQFIETEVVPSFSPHEAYVVKSNEWTKRFEAIRSISGLSYGEDPAKYPKLEPWEGSSDTGLPLEAITLRAIIARFVKTIFTKPICIINARGREDKQDAKIVQEYNEYTLQDEMNFERTFYDIMMDVGLDGDGYGKLIEADEEYEWEETYFTLIHPETQEPIPDPSTMNEFDKEEWPNGYPIEVQEDFKPQPDIASGIVPEVKEITITKKDKTYFGTKLIPIDPKDLVLPKDADTYDLDQLPFIGHRFSKNWHWLKDREGAVEDGGYDEEVIQKIKPEGDKGKVSTVSKIKLVEIWARVDLPIAGKDNNQVREIIILYCIDSQQVLGWIPNPYRGQRMIFHWQIMPMPHRTRGKGIPEFAMGIRNLCDSLFNNLVNRDTINSHPPFIYDEESGFDPEIHEFGPQEFWGVNDKTKLGRLDMGNYSESRSEWAINFAMNLLQKLFGVNDYTAGNDNNSQNKTARGIMAIIGEGNYSFDTMIALLQMTNKKFFEANIKMHAKMMKDSGMENKVFNVTEDKNNPFRKIATQTLALGWNFIPSGTSIDNNLQRRRVDAQESYGILSKNLLFSPELTPTTADNYREITQNVVDAYNLKIVLPNKEQLTQEMIQTKAQVEQEIQKKQQLEQLKATAKIKKGTPEGQAAQKVLDDIQLGQGQGQPPQGGPGQ